MSAIVLEDVSFSYGFGPRTISVLNELSLDVQAGTIYGLLGPSGCGKTTVLSCCLGVLQPSSGSVQIFGKRPNTKGKIYFFCIQGR